MPNYRRAVVPGGTFFLTVGIYNRHPFFGDPNIVSLLGDAIRNEQRNPPFTIDAFVLDSRWACGTRLRPNFDSIENVSGEP